ncbi:cysteine hydrolase [uncultured Alsobacter sp.]|uniref:cysteine hydrolase family protein n=1 Tax=uncultured Alsobacter sp. TaxID=1748258 RepID=UPI0025D475C1|nr:cysteine hydrolase [uncultured Alsobacter sp.]
MSGKSFDPPGPRAVHLCIDMQRLFSDDGPWPTPWMERVLPVVARLAERAPERTVFSRFMPPHRPEDRPGRWRAYYERWRDATLDRLDPALVDLMPALARLAPPAEVFDKPTYSAFADGRLHRRLSARGCDTVVVSGAETDMCVLATCLGAVDLGYRVIVVTDAVCSSSDEGHDSLLALYASRFSLQIETATCDELLAVWPARDG